MKDEEKTLTNNVVPGHSGKRAVAIDNDWFVTDSLNGKLAASVA